MKIFAVCLSLILVFLLWYWLWTSQSTTYQREPSGIGATMKRGQDACKGIRAQLGNVPQSQLTPNDLAALEVCK